MAIVRKFLAPGRSRSCPCSCSSLFVLLFRVLSSFRLYSLHFLSHSTTRRACRSLSFVAPRHRSSRARALACRGRAWRCRLHDHAVASMRRRGCFTPRHASRRTRASTFAGFRRRFAEHPRRQATSHAANPLVLLLRAAFACCAGFEDGQRPRAHRLGASHDCRSRRARGAGARAAHGHV